MRAGFRVLAPDARGFGRSTFPQVRLTVPVMAGDMITLLERLQAGPACVVGISMGGAVALQLALDCPQVVRRLVLVNTFARLRPQSPQVWLYFALRFLLVHTLGLATQARAVARRIFPRPDQLDLRDRLIEQILQADPRGYRAAMRALALFDVRARLGGIACPTLVISGERDTTVPVPLQRALAESIPHARQILIPGAGHAVIAERPDDFNRILIDFLSAHEGSSTLPLPPMI
jgi:pimeloyl-ACP methyl ester carboxylesterase